MSESLPLDPTHSRSAEAIAQASAGLGSGALTEAGISTLLRPLFARTLAAAGIYLASHSLGRPLDCVQDDLCEGASLWQQRLVGAWEPWLEQEANYRRAIAGLLGAPRLDCVVPRTSAGHALRSVLNMLPQGARVLATEGEFQAIGMLLAQYASLGRIDVELAPPRTLAGLPSRFAVEALATMVQRSAAAGRPFALVVVSQVFFATGQLLSGLDELARSCQMTGAQLLVDAYHSLGAVPINVAEMGCDYMIGGCYKYLRGGPGLAFLYLSPQALAQGARPLDTGWFALEPASLEPALIKLGETGPSLLGQGPRLRPGGDAHLEGTPAVLTYYQARSGLAFTGAIGVDRLRAYSLLQLQALKAMLAERGIASLGGDQEHGAFLSVAARDAQAVVAALAAEGITVNARHGRIRLCPDCLTTRSELEATAEALARCHSLL